MIVSWLNITDPRIAGLVSALETAVLGAVAAFALNLGAALMSAGNTHQPFSFDWTSQIYLLEGTTLTAFFKGIATTVGVTQSNKGTQ